MRGLTNKINKGMKQTISSENPEYFFFYHNGITALCEKLLFQPASRKLTLHGLGVVNGCQSVTTILSCSERVKAHPEAQVLVRFYEIRQRDLADKISIYTNSQSAVKPRVVQILPGVGPVTAARLLDRIVDAPDALQTVRDFVPPPAAAES